MRISILSINDNNIQLPALLFKKSGLSKDVEVEVKKGEIRIVSAAKKKAHSVSLALSEKALATDWNRKEEDKAWESLQ